jgi:putative transposase
MDFVSDAINRAGAVSRRIKCLTVADDFSHECVDIPADFGIGGDYVTRLLDRAAMFHGHPYSAFTKDRNSLAGHS